MRRHERILVILFGASDANQLEDSLLTPFSQCLALAPAQYAYALSSDARPLSDGVPPASRRAQPRQQPLFARERLGLHPVVAYFGWGTLNAQQGGGFNERHL